MNCKLVLVCVYMYIYSDFSNCMMKIKIILKLFEFHVKLKNLQVSRLSCDLTQMYIHITSTNTT